MRRLTLVLIAVGTIAVSCYKDDASAPTGIGANPLAKILLTDAPFPFDTVERVDVYIISVAVSTQPDTGSSGDDSDWEIVAEPHRQVNLLELQRGDTALLGQREIPAGQYRAVRVILDTDSSAGIRYADGTQAQVHWNGPARQSIHAFVERPMEVSAAGTEIVIDFDVGRSFHYNDLDDGAFNFLPWLRAVNRAATGDIVGTVVRDTGGGNAPVSNATVSAWGRGPDTWHVYSTGVTDAAGSYRLAYLLSGTYIVGVDPPAASGYASVLDSNVVVTSGATTTHHVTLAPFSGSIMIQGASSMLVGRTNELEAIVVTAQQQQDPDAPVAWQNLDTAVLGLVDSLRFARVTSKAIGTGRIVAASGSLADTLTIQVAADTSSAPSSRQ